MDNALVNNGVGYPVHGWSQGVCGGGEGSVPYNPTPWWFWAGIVLAVMAGNKQKRARK